MLDLNVREVMADERVDAEAVDTIVQYKECSADPKAAFERLGCLKYTLEKLERDINRTDVRNTEESWHVAYAHITRAFRECIAEEKRIICNN